MTIYRVSSGQDTPEAKVIIEPPKCWYCGADVLSQRTRRFPKTLTCDACGATTVPQLRVDMGADYERIRARLNPGERAIPISSTSLPLAQYGKG